MFVFKNNFSKSNEFYLKIFLAIETRYFNRTQVTYGVEIIAMPKCGMPNKYENGENVTTGLRIKPFARIILVLNNIFFCITLLIVTINSISNFMTETAIHIRARIHSLCIYDWNKAQFSV